MTRRLLDGGHRVIVFDPRPEVVEASVERGAVGAASIAELVSALAVPRAVWLMVPVGEATHNTITEAASHLSAGDCLIDGGNSYYKDSVRRAATLAKEGKYFLDVGTSGGIWGITEGYCLMVGGEMMAFQRLEPIFQTLAPSPDNGYGYVGPSGAGHFVKMVHNGVEYGLMEAYAEGFELMQAKQEFGLDMAKIAEIWRHGSVVRSWLLELVAAALRDDPGLEDIEAYVEDSGEGRWTVQESIELAVPAPVIAQSLQNRFRSRQAKPFGTRLLAALRQQFGGHAVRKAGK
jgi:6-phosphogluconate dehydrogenase